MLTPPGPTSRPTTMSTIPHKNCFRNRETMPEITSITAKIQSMKSMADVYPPDTGFMRA